MDCTWDYETCQCVECLIDRGVIDRGEQPEEKRVMREMYDALKTGMSDFPMPTTMPVAYGRDYPDPWDDDGYEPNPLRGRVLDVERLRLIPPPVPMNDVLFYDSIAWLAGQPGAYKSFLAVQWACEQAVQGQRVLYVAAEGGSGLARRIDAWELASRRRVGEYLMVLPEVVPLRSSWHHLVDLAAELRPKLIVVDTQARMMAGLDENAAGDMGEYVEGADSLRKATGACVLTVHHSAKGGAALRGHSVIEGAADTVIQINRPDRMQPVVSVVNYKQKDDRQRPEYWLRPADQANGSMVLVECERPEWWPKN